MFIKKIFDFYINGFKNMRLGKSLWLIILIKLFVILVVLKFFIYDNSIKNFDTAEQKSQFVYKNMMGEK